MIKNTRIVFKYISFVFKIDKSYFIISALIQVLQSISPILMLWLPRMVIDEITQKGNFGKVLFYVCVMVGMQIFSGVIINLLTNNKFNLRVSHITNYVNVLINRKCAELDLLQVQTSEIYDKLNLAK